MTEKAQVKVELDTKPAKRKLRDLGRAGEAAAGRINKKGASGKAGSFGGSLAQGFGFGAGFGLGKKIAGSVGIFSAIGDVVGDATVGLRAQMDLGL